MRKKEEMDDIFEKERMKKMNKTAKAKCLAKKEKEVEAAKFKEDL